MSDIGGQRKLLAYYDKRKLEVDDHDTNDIIKTMKKYHPIHQAAYDKISDSYWLGSPEKTAKGLFSFLKKNVRYKIEPEDYQTVKTPAAILHEGYGDCKHYASFITGICDSLQRKGYPIKSKYRFISDAPGKEVHHVFGVVIDPAGKDYWVDPVLSSFDRRPQFYNTKDMKGIGAVYHISGVGIGKMDSLFKNGSDIKRFLAKRGVTPQHFGSADHMASYLAYHIENPTQNVHPTAFVAGVGNIFDKIGKGIKQAAHGLAVDAQNLGKGVKQTTKKVTTAVKKAEHGLVVDAKNVQKGVQQAAHKVNTAVKKAEHGLAVDAKNVAKGANIALKQAEHLVMKIGGAAARNAFLAALDMNAFNLANRSRAGLLSDKRNGLLNRWKDLGGNPQKLINATNNGYKRYKGNHGGYLESRDKVSGIGVVTVAAIMALASAIIAALAAFMPHPSPEDAAAMADASQTGAEEIAGNTAAQNDNAAADALNTITLPGTDSGTMSVSTGVDAAGNPVLQVHDVSSDATDNAGQATPDPDGTDVAPHTEGIMDKVKDAFHKAEAFVKDNKVAVGMAAVGIVGYKVMTKGGTRRRKKSWF